MFLLALAFPVAVVTSKGGGGVIRTLPPRPVSTTLPLGFLPLGPFPFESDLDTAGYDRRGISVLLCILGCVEEGAQGAIGDLLLPLTPLKPSFEEPDVHEGPLAVHMLWLDDRGARGTLWQRGR